MEKNGAREFAAACLCSAFVLTLLSCGNTPGEDRSAEQADLWYQAVASGDEESAVHAASSLLDPRDLPEHPFLKRYEFMGATKGIAAEHFVSSFNEYDFLCWRDALLFKNQAEDLTKGLDNRKDMVEALLQGVIERLDASSVPAGIVPWPSTAWETRRGSCDQMAWVLCELAYQIGFRCQLVYLRNPETLESPHTICELRYKDNFWVVDPFARKLLHHTSMKDLASDPRRVARIWPDRKDWQEAVPKFFLWTPSYPQDYCARNQALYDTLKSVLGARCPRFGEDPGTRMYRYFSEGNQTLKKPLNSMLWRYPFSLLRGEMRKRKGMQTKE